jgi:glycerol-3-phosphate acyltransferase PlsY
MLKGTAAVLIAHYFIMPEVAIVAGLGAFLGHLFPVWLKFKGGKGVATYIGILIGLAWPAAIAFCVIWLATAWVTRYSSASALTASAITPGLLWWLHYPREALLFVVLSVLVFIMHRANIARLIAGTETRIGNKAAQP